MTQATLHTWPAGFLLMADLEPTIPAELQFACELANAAAYADCGHRATCILTSHALAAYLREHEGLDADLVRVEAHVHTRCRCETKCHGRYCTGSILGSPPLGERLPVTRPGWWRGHLAVTCNGYLLDPTIDQANTDLIHLRPMVVPLPGEWDRGQYVQVADGDDAVGWCKYYRQVGWKSAGDARPSHWRPVVDLMMEGNYLWGDE